MGFLTCDHTFAGFAGLGYFGDTAFDVEGLRRFTDEVVLFIYQHSKDKATVISSRSVGCRFASGEVFDTSLINETTPCFEFSSLPSPDFSIGAVMFPLGDDEIPYSDAHELASLFTPKLSGLVFCRTDREAVYGVKNAASFFGCGFHYEGREYDRISFESSDGALGVIFLVFCAMFRRLSQKRGFNFKLESASGMPAFAISADMHLQNADELEQAYEFICLKEIFECRGLPLLYRFSTNNDSPRLILRFSSARVSRETLLRASLPAGITDYSQMSEEELIPDVAGEY